MTAVPEIEVMQTRAKACEQLLELEEEIYKFSPRASRTHQPCQHPGFGAMAQFGPLYIIDH